MYTLFHVFIVFSELEGDPCLRGGDCQQGLKELHEQRHQHITGGLSQQISKIRNIYRKEKLMNIECQPDANNQRNVKKIIIAERGLCPSLLIFSPSLLETPLSSPCLMPW